MPHPSRRDEFLAGVRAELPLLLGVAPFGMAYGAYALDSGISAGSAQAMSAVVFGGASQLALVRAFTDGVAGAIVILTVLLVNSRHLLYSASLAPHVADVPRRWRLLLAYLLTDEAYAAAITRYRDRPAAPHHRWFVLGAGIALWLCWQLTTALGLFAGAAVDESLALDFALPVTFIALVVPSLNSRGAVAAAAVSGVMAVVGNGWPHGTGLISAALAGIVAGVLASLPLNSPAEPA